MIKICIICVKEYECYDRARKGSRKGKFKRKSDSLTCSKKCAIIHERRKKMKKVKVIRNFFRNGELIRKGQIMKVDKMAFKQLVIEERLCEEQRK